MRILYGICGEGLGHATRSKVVIAHLLRRGHHVLACAANHAYPVLAKLSGPVAVMPIVGLGMRCANGAMDLRGTLELNAQRLPAMLRDNNAAWQAAAAFTPDAVIADFDSFACLFAKAHGLPIVSIDNAQVLVRCAHDEAILEPHRSGYRALASLMDLMAQHECHHYIVTSFFYPSVWPTFATSTTLVPPILRPEVLATLNTADDSERDHCLVYKTSSLDDASFVNVLAALPRERFVVYGVSDSARLPPNAERRAFDERRFIHDLSTSRAVLGSGGMSLLGEAIALRKPVFAVPVRGQYEQVLNASYLARLGYGATSETLHPGAVGEFLEHIPHYKRALKAAPRHDHNARLFQALDALLT